MQSKGILSTDLAKELKIKPSEVINLLGKIRKADFKKNTTRVKISLEESEKIRGLYNKSLTKKKIDDKKQSIIPKTRKKTYPIIKDKSPVISTESLKSEDKEKEKPLPVVNVLSETIPYQKSAFETYLETLTKESLTTPLSQPIETIKEEGKSVEEDIHIPDRFKKEIEGEKIEKIKVKPTMQKAFQTIKKIESGKWIGRKTFKRLKDKRKKTEQIIQQQITAPRKKKLKFIEGTTVKEFAELIGQKSSDVIKKFIGLGYMPTINQPVDVDAVVLVADSFGIKIEIIASEQLDIIEEEKDNVTALKPRPPVVTIMGHVDHGKTSLLDAIRKTNVIATEAGGITQHIGAYRVSLDNRDITFLDTPGHEAFTSLRARGAKVTDIVVLVVAADDGVMPQTVEAINHAKAANVPIIVTINKIDKPEANIQRVRNELSEYNIVSEEWGGQNIFVEISAKKLIGIKNILEMILLQSDIMELKANPDKLARGTIIEAKLDKGRGTVATVLIQSGTLKIGDIFVAGTTYGKVRTLINDTGFKIQEAGPSMPVEVIGFSDIPTAGDMFTAISDEKRARQIAIIREQKQKIGAGAKYQKLTLDELYAKIKEGKVKDLNIIIKGDVQGSVEAIKKSFEDITHQEVKVKVIHAAIGGINESDVMLAATSSAIIIGFNVRPELKVSQLAEKEGVDIRLYNIIYEAIEDVKKAFEGLLSPTFKEKILGRAEVRHLFTASNIGNIAGCYVIDGVINRSSNGVRIIRDSIVVYESKINSLKRFKDDVKEVQSGYECGIVIENFNDLKVGDIIENYIIEKTATKL